MVKSSDIEYMGDLRAAVARPSRVAANLLLFAIVGFIVWGVYWTSRASLDEVTVGMGKVIPSTEVQIVQNLEGGIVSKILINLGDTVKKGQLLMVIDDTQYIAKYREDSVKRLGLLAVATRLTAEINGVKPKFPKEIRVKSPSLIKREKDLMRSRAKEVIASVGVLKRQREQKTQEIVELESRIQQLNQGYGLAQEELEIMTPMVDRGITSRVELIRLKRSIIELKTSISGAELALPRAHVAVEEVDQRIAEKRAGFRSLAMEELNEVKINLDAISENIKGTTDRLKRTNVTSPVDGNIIQIKINTVGGVIKPGMDLIEIVPLDSSLLVKAKIKPSDIAFLNPAQSAKVKITAFDSTIYGTLDATLETISADTIVDENGDSFYEIRVRTSKNYIEGRDGPLKIIPGMTAEVDVLTGNKTVLDYLLKPLLRARANALRER
jgi:adhesin transport system membrane fusion protein